MDVPINDNRPHYDFYDMMAEFGSQPLMRIAARGLDRRLASNIYWFMRFEQAMLNWEVQYKRSNLEIIR